MCEIIAFKCECGEITETSGFEKPTTCCIVCHKCGKLAKEKVPRPESKPLGVRVIFKGSGWTNPSGRFG